MLEAEYHLPIESSSGGYVISSSKSNKGDKFIASLLQG